MITIVLTLIATPAAQASSSGAVGVTLTDIPEYGWADDPEGSGAKLDYGLGEVPQPRATGQPASLDRASRLEDGVNVTPERRTSSSPTSRTLQLAIQRLRHGVQERRSAAWRHQDWLGVQRHKTAYRERQTRSAPYLKWLRGLWSLRAHRLHKLRARTLRDFPFAPGNSAWFRAVEEVQRVFPGTSGWLLSCSAAEGGHGRWVGYGGQGYSTWLRDSDTVGGPLQFRYSTFTGMYRAARAHIVTRGYKVGLGPDLTAAWKSALGQALAGAWARFTGNDASHWSASWERGCS